MAKNKSSNNAKPIEINTRSNAMLSGPTLILVPYWSLTYGGLAEGLVLNQLIYLSDAMNECVDEPTVRISYSRLQKHLPFYSRRWLIEIIKRLEDKNAIKAIHTGRVNEIEVRKTYKPIVKWTEYNSAKLLIFPKLACKVGLLESIALQQIHIRHHDSDGSMWVIRSLKKWHQGTFMFLGEATVKRLFSRLKLKGLIYVKDYPGELGVTKSYRVNYLKVAEVLEIPVPTVSVPEMDKWSSPWTNPIYPFAPPIKPPGKG